MTTTTLSTDRLERQVTLDAPRAKAANIRKFLGG